MPKKEIKVTTVNSKGFSIGNNKTVLCSNANCCDVGNIKVEAPAIISDGIYDLEARVNLCNKCYKVLKEKFGKEKK